MLKEVEKLNIDLARKGISPIIAFVLILGLVISLATFVSFWYQGVTESQIDTALEMFEDTPECNGVRYEVGFDYSTCSITLFNAGDEEINKLVLSYAFSDGSTNTETREVTLPPNARETVSEVPNFAEATFTPILIRETKQISCTDERTFTLDQPFECCYSDADCPGDHNLCKDNACVSVDCIADGECEPNQLCLENNCEYVSCTEVADCPGSLPACQEGICIYCTEDAECKDPAYCVEEDGTCAECTDNAHCDPGKICENNVCVEDAECTENTNCLSWEVCTGGECTYCTWDIQCDVDSDERCTSNGLCLVNCDIAECTLDETCIYDEGVQQPFCMLNPGISCDVDGQCLTGLCDGGICAECSSDDHCAAGEICEDNTCIVEEPESPGSSCQDNADCLSWEACVDGECDFCTEDNQCDQSDYEICVGPDDICLVVCRHAEERCGAHESCVDDSYEQEKLCKLNPGIECYVDGQCLTGLCDGGICAECSSDDHCTDNTKLYCSDANECVECISDGDCKEDKPYCARGNFCVECTSNEECPRGETCGFGNKCV